MDRELIAKTYLRGNGIEIGALHNPLKVPSVAKVQYVDRMQPFELRKHYPELDGAPLVSVDIIADGECLEPIENDTQDFVIANHFLEHCQNPIKALTNMFRVLRPGGILYLAVPDKRFTFDIDRPVTSMDHLMRDYTEGPEWSRREHFTEWARWVSKVGDENAIEAEVDRLISIDYSIHFHVWTQREVLELLTSLRRQLNLHFELELFFQNAQHEVIAIMRKPKQPVEAGELASGNGNQGPGS